MIHHLYISSELFGGRRITEWSLFYKSHEATFEWFLWKERNVFFGGNLAQWCLNQEITIKFVGNIAIWKPNIIPVKYLYWNYLKDVSRIKPYLQMHSYIFTFKFPCRLVFFMPGIPACKFHSLGVEREVALDCHPSFYLLAGYPLW